MSHRALCVFAWTALAAGIASSQSFPADLQNYLKLSGPQVQSITDLNKQFQTYGFQQAQQNSKLTSLATQELQKDSPDASVVGDAYAQLEMLRRDTQTQLAQLQGKISAVLTMDQVALVNALLDVERLQPLVSEAQSASLLPVLPTAILETVVLTVPTAAERTGYFGTPYYQVPLALTNYLKLTDAQIALIENAVTGNQDYVNRQYFKWQDLQNEITDLTAAPTIDAAKLGADYVAMSQITKDEATQKNQLITTARSVLTDAQQPAMQALDNANNLSATANDAVCQNVLVLPADLQRPCCNGIASFLLGYVAIYNPAMFLANGCGLVPTALLLKAADTSSTH